MCFWSWWELTDEKRENADSDFITGIKNGFKWNLRFNNPQVLSKSVW